jgi:predicted nucleotidyltransferase
VERDAELPLDRILSVLAERLLGGDRDELLMLYLFGSAARGETRADSDFDLALLAARPLDPVAVFDAAGDLAALLSRDVDLVDLARASTVMRVQVLSGGRRLHVGDSLRAAEFEMYALSDYARLQEERRHAVAAFEERLRD